MTMTPARLYGILEHALAASRPTLYHPLVWRRVPLWMTEPSVTIGTRVWWATKWDGRGFGFARRHVREMLRHLRRELRAYRELCASVKRHGILDVATHGGDQPDGR